ncbi:hypothetical protein SAMN05421780_102139 [Flexibacter flexilis DSM 6793]|uniref:Double zinc ribbon n=1 Tax=Flexibacter flexilis DSM 6793 TaxID=927664 RepID=A0A1I1FE37_9BACT|nr:hypothetical protein [Flexibacter flexilis]SFB97206.1 hypothetical protein SAMN05421780_102139 [Flexibacter flexilis DSM 6793]
MELNAKKLERISKFIYYSISISLCIFLVLLSGNIIDDLDSAVLAPMPTQFENKQLLGKIDKQISAQNIEIDNLNSQRESIEKTIAIARQNYANEKESFENWLKTRKTLGSPDKDREVTDRAKKLDEYYKVEQDWRAQLADLESKTQKIEQLRNKQQTLLDEEKERAQDVYVVEYKYYELKVFLIRLLFVAPVLGLGIFFVVRFRNHKFWPLFFGFTLFSLYAFFFGLVPYLPSYGGYVRSTVGILMSVFLGYYAIKNIRKYIETKQEELKTSTQVRAKNVQQAVAEKALDNHYCPSCGKDFIIKTWDAPLKNADTNYKLVTNFCRYCGLELFKNCHTCGNKNFVHLPYCASCGTATLGVSDQRADNLTV